MLALQARLQAGDSPIAPVNVPSWDFAAGEIPALVTPLSLAVMGRHPKAVKLLLDRGAPLESGLMPDAVYQGPTMVRQFLDAGFDPNTRLDVWPWRGGTALHWATYYRELEVIGLLLDAGADPRQLDDFGRSPISLVSQRQGADSRRIEEILRRSVNGVDERAP